MTPTRPTAFATNQPAPELDIERWSATSGNGRPSRASLVLVGGDRRWRAHATGNGAVDALLRAADVALAPLLGPGVQLLTYEVHATGPGHETTAVVTVSIGAREDDDPTAYPGRASSENVLEASLAAYVDAIGRFVAGRGVDVAGMAPAPGATSRHAAEPEDEVRSHLKRDMLRLYNG